MTLRGIENGRKPVESARICEGDLLKLMRDFVSTSFLPSFVAELKQLLHPAAVGAPALMLTLGLVVGCGSNGTPGTSGGGPVQGESTEVTLVASSTANDQLTRFSLFLNSLTLTNKAGTSVTLISAPQQVEFARQYFFAARFTGGLQRQRHAADGL
jgi:hypothetical protein